ncbi:CUB and sushi domain-containing protein 1-like [Glandiceps talaboti]
MTTSFQLLSGNGWSPRNRCGGSFDLFTGGTIEISSPNYPADYPRRSACKWTIYASSSSRMLQISWVDFCTETGFDYISIGNGDAIGENTMIGRHSGCQIPQDFTSNSDSIWLVFETDHSSHHRGFRLIVNDILATCQVQPCHGNATCVENFSGVACICPNGFYGSRCEYEICGKQTCHGKATCLNYSRGFMCICPWGFTGERCGTETCLNNPCHEGATCDDSSEGFFCHCPQDYIGHRCEIWNVCEDTFNMAQGGNITITSPKYPGDYPNSRSCRWIIYASKKWRNIHVSWDTFCTEGYFDFVSIGNGDVTGKNVLLEEYSGCAGLPKDFYSESDSLWMTFTSDFNIVQSGFRVVMSETLETCQADPCDNNATCADNSRGFSCICPVGYSGLRCETEVCQPNSCHGNATCVDHASGFYCVCKSGFTGIRCEREPVPPCKRTYHLDGDGSMNILSPNYPDIYRLYEQCEWIIHASAPSRIIYLSWEDMCTEDGYDFVSLGSGDVIGENTLIDQYSGCTPPEDVYSESDIVWMTFTSDYSENERGFSVMLFDTKETCLAQPCNGDATCIDGDLSFTCICPIGFSGRRCEFVTCEASPCYAYGTATCVDSSTGFSCNCSDGYFGSECQYENCRPDSCQSNATCVDDLYGFRCICPPRFTGLRCTTELSPPCNKTYHLVTGGNVTITSPNYPDVYPDEEECYWIFYASSSSRILFLSWEEFCTESDFDFVSIGNGEVLGQDVLYDSLTGCTLPQDIYSPGDILWMEFSTDWSVNAAGFHVFVSDFIENCQTHPCQGDATCIGDSSSFSCLCPLGRSGDRCEIETCLTNPCYGSATCVDELSGFSCSCPPGLSGSKCEFELPPPCTFTHYLDAGDNLTITSPNYPNFYPNGEECEWIIYASSPSHVIHLLWSDFCTEHGYDFVSVGNGDVIGEDILMDWYTGCIAVLPFYSDSGSIWMTFTSDSSEAERGFMVTMQATKGLPCENTHYLGIGGNIAITSPNYPDSYADRKDCTWIIHASSSTSNIHLIWDDFCTENVYDYITVGNGDVIGEHVVINHHSGCDKPTNLSSNGNSLWITFHSDRSINDKGFRVLLRDVTGD